MELLTETPLVTPDYWRQLDVFNPESFQEEIHIIGVGALGSWIALVLAKMGVQQIHAWDFDQVEPHNLPNQIYGRGDAGLNKVDALARRLSYDCSTEVIPHLERVDGSQKLSGIVYLCTDKMSSRTEIWHKAIKLNLSVRLMVEGRLGAEIGQIHTVCPTNRRDIQGFENTLFTDEEGEESPCTYRAIATTVGTIACLAAHKLVKYVALEKPAPIVTITANPELEHSSADMFCIRPILITTNDWKS